MSFNQRIETALQARKKIGLERSLVVLEGGNSPQLMHGNKSYSNFSSNDYMGLASSKELAKAWQEGIALFGVGSGASPLVTGFSNAHLKLEESLCQWLGYQRAVLFSSGFSANQAVLFSLLEKEDRLIQDRLNHASLMEAGMLSSAQMKRFKHNDMQHLLSCLAEDRQNLLVTEGVFSMDGDLAPLVEMADIANKSNSWLMVDDAHGIGVHGRDGAGSCTLAGIKPDILVVTFGKAFGLSGAAVLCNESVGDYLTQFARHHVYSTAIPPSQAYALAHAATMLKTEQWRRDKLEELQSIYKTALQGIEGYVETSTPIKPFICGDIASTMALVKSLSKEGIWVTAIRPPTVAKDSCRIRITLTANHTSEQVTELTQCILNFSERSSRAY